jgi:hypothetical protein
MSPLRDLSTTSGNHDKGLLTSEFESSRRHVTSRVFAVVCGFLADARDDLPGYAHFAGASPIRRSHFESQRVRISVMSGAPRSTIGITADFSHSIHPKDVPTSSVPYPNVSNRPPSTERDPGGRRKG